MCPWDAYVKQCADSHYDTIAQSVLAAFIRDGHLARHVRRMRPIYAARRKALLEGLHRELDAWLEPIASEPGLHLAASIRVQPALELFAFCWGFVANVTMPKWSAGKTPKWDKESTAQPQSATPVNMTENPLALLRKVSISVAYSMVYRQPMTAASAFTTQIPDTFR